MDMAKFVQLGFDSSVFAHKKNHRKTGGIIVKVKL